MKNGRLKARAIAALEGSKAVTPADEKLEILILLSLDTLDAVDDHESRLVTLEAYPVTVKRVSKLLVGLGAVAAALVALAALIS
jgi:hypothetical protein